MFQSLGEKKLMEENDKYKKILCWNYFKISCNYKESGVYIFLPVKKWISCSVNMFLNSAIIRLNIEGKSFVFMRVYGNDVRNGFWVCVTHRLYKGI